LLMIALVAAAGSVALAQTEAAPIEERPLQLTEDEAAALRRAQDLQKELEIARLEVALAQAKDLPEGEIASRAEQMYRLQGRLYALHAKSPELARKVRRHQRQQRWLHREGMGRGHGRGMGRGRGHGRRGMGRGRGHEAWGMGPGMGRGRGHRGHGFAPGVGRGRGHGPGAMRGRGMGRGRGRGGPGMGLGRGPELGLGLRMTDPAQLHLAPGFLPPDIEVEVAPKAAD
jgi:hypothetical protein